MRAERRAVICSSMAGRCGRFVKVADGCASSAILCRISAYSNGVETRRAGVAIYLLYAAAAEFEL